MATCRHCGINSRDPSQPITITIKATELAVLHLVQDGRRIDINATAELECRCGYRILGWVDGDTFLGEPDTERFPQ